MTVGGSMASFKPGCGAALVSAKPKPSTTKPRADSSVHHRRERTTQDLPRPEASVTDWESERRKIFAFFGHDVPTSVNAPEARTTSEVAMRRRNDDASPREASDPVAVPPRPEDSADESRHADLLEEARFDPSSLTCPICARGTPADVAIASEDKEEEKEGVGAKNPKMTEDFTASRTGPDDESAAPEDYRGPSILLDEDGQLAIGGVFEDPLLEEARFDPSRITCPLCALEDCSVKASSSDVNGTGPSILASEDLDDDRFSCVSDTYTTSLYEVPDYEAVPGFWEDSGRDPDLKYLVFYDAKGAMEAVTEIFKKYEANKFTASRAKIIDYSVASKEDKSQTILQRGVISDEGDLPAAVSAPLRFGEKTSFLVEPEERSLEGLAPRSTWRRSTTTTLTGTNGCSIGRRSVPWSGRSLRDRDTLPPRLPNPCRPV